MANAINNKIKLISLNHAAAIVGVSPQTLRRWTKIGHVGGLFRPLGKTQRAEIKFVEDQFIDWIRQEKSPIPDNNNNKNDK